MNYDSIRQKLLTAPKSWCVTGAAGFIGSHLVSTLLSLNQKVSGLDNFATGLRSNLDAIKTLVKPEQWDRFTFHEGDIRSAEDCAKALSGCELLSHQAALGSVPRSLADPVLSTSVNIDGFVQILKAAKEGGVQRVVYASSSSVYGDSPELPKVEERIGHPLSPYALTKSVNEQLAAVFSRCYGTNAIGLRYFNVFGPRQDPNGPYAAVLPRWATALKSNQRPVIFGDGETSRDFCFVDNAVQANILAALSDNPEASGAVFNVACGEKHSLKSTLKKLSEVLGKSDLEPVYEKFRDGDVRHSLANIEKARRVLGYEPTVKLAEGLKCFAS